MYEYFIHIEVEANSEKDAQTRLNEIIRKLNGNWDIDVIDHSKIDYTDNKGE